MLVAYLAIVLAVSSALLGRRSHRVFEMSWSDLGVTRDRTDAEVLLEFTRFPGHVVGIYSTPLRDYVKSLDRPMVEVEFELTRDLGCLRGFHEVRVGTLQSWRSSGGYAGTHGEPTASPWGADPWWCP